MSDNMSKNIFTKEKIIVIKEYIDRCFPDYKIHHDGYDFDRIAWNFSLSNKDGSNGRIFFVTVQKTFFENQNESEISTALGQYNLNDYFDDSVEGIRIGYMNDRITNGRITIDVE